MDAIDIVLLSHNRLEYLAATVEALHARTPEPFRLTIVDNASASAVRNWLVEHRDLFHRQLFQAENQHVAGFQRGIDATTSDPFVVSDPDLIVPDLEPSWLARLLDLMDRHPDFGLIGVGLDKSNRPALIGPETYQESAVVDGELVEAAVGTSFQMIRRDALRVPYEKDNATCIAVREAGYRVGWTPTVRAFHLGWDDHRRFPVHLASKNALPTPYLPSPYPQYPEVELIARPPSLQEVARAAPVVEHLRRERVPWEAVLEFAWDAPILRPVIDSVQTVHPPPKQLHLDDRSAAAVVLVAPPAELALAALEAAARVSTTMVVAVVPLQTFGGRTAADLAPPGWQGVEASATGQLPMELARRGDELPALAGHLRYTTLEHRDDWLALFADGAIPPEVENRLFVFTADDRSLGPERVTLPSGLVPWEPLSRTLPTPPPPSWKWQLRHAVATRAPAPIVRALRRVGGRQS